MHGPPESLHKGRENLKGRKRNAWSSPQQYLFFQRRVPLKMGEGSCLLLSRGLGLRCRKRKTKKKEDENYWKIKGWQTEHIAAEEKS